MQAVKITYLFFIFVLKFTCLGIVFYSPVGFTPGWYWWSFLFFIVFAVLCRSTYRLVNKWSMGDRIDKLAHGG